MFLKILFWNFFLCFQLLKNLFSKIGNDKVVENLFSARKILFCFFSNRNLFFTLVYSNSHVKDVTYYKKKFRSILFQRNKVNVPVVARLRKPFEDY